MAFSTYRRSRLAVAHDSLSLMFKLRRQGYRIGKRLSNLRTAPPKILPGAGTTLLGKRYAFPTAAHLRQRLPPGPGKNLARSRAQALRAVTGMAIVGRRRRLELNKAEMRRRSFEHVVPPHRRASAGAAPRPPGVVRHRRRLRRADRRLSLPGRRWRSRRHPPRLPPTRWWSRRGPKSWPAGQVTSGPRPLRGGRPAPLGAAEVPQALDQPLTVQLSDSERSRINDTHGVAEGKYLIGVARYIGTVIDLSSALPFQEVLTDLRLGAARGTGDGGFVWTAAVEAPGATALRLHLIGVDLPHGPGSTSTTSRARRSALIPAAARSATAPSTPTRYSATSCCFSFTCRRTRPPRG
jgi:hypothetical protein